MKHEVCGMAVDAWIVELEEDQVKIIMNGVKIESNFSWTLLFDNVPIS